MADSLEKKRARVIDSIALLVGPMLAEYAKSVTAAVDAEERPSPTPADWLCECGHKMCHHARRCKKCNCDMFRAERVPEPKREESAVALIEEAMNDRKPWSNTVDCLTRALAVLRKDGYR